ncbi:MAG: hypothetical protein H7230_02035 [Candidatus Parcubacteria bacterium]|nr:hypothetical protein [Candidatus Paceibacterota bacterium]
MSKSLKKSRIDSETNLTPRQRNLLFAVVKEYCEFGNTVSSQDLKAKYNFDISPATIRNEFINLRKLNYLYQPFTNASSQPTEKAFKLFINQLVAGVQITSKQQHELRRQITELESRQDSMQKEISKLLALETDSVSFAFNDQTESYTGLKHLMGAPKSEEASQILDFLENLDQHKQLFLEHNQGTPKNKSGITTIFSGENPILPLGNGYAIVATETMLNNQKTVFGIITQPHIIGRKKTLQIINAITEILNGKI